jgi:hypothetical protein
MPEKSSIPSKQFIIRGSIAIGIVAIILIVQTTWFRKIFNHKKVTGVTPSTVGDVITRDTNGNGIPDWEEKLWGLDPSVLYTNGVSNKKIIEDKKKALGVTTPAGGTINDTDELARELFTFSTALGQSGEVDDQTLQNIASKLGSSIDVKEVSNHYSLKDIRTISTTNLSLKTYYATMAKIIARYDTETADIDVIINALETGDTSRLPELANSAVIYTQIAKDMVAINVPIGIADYHLAIINGFSGISQSFTYLAQMNDDAMAGLMGMAIYKTYNTKITNALNKERDYLSRYGIL